MSSSDRIFDLVGATPLSTGSEVWEVTPLPGVYVTAIVAWTSSLGLSLCC